jgi:hypothetical protein
MKERGSLLLGRALGHIMFGDNYFGYDDALYGAVPADRHRGAPGAVR